MTNLYPRNSRRSFPPRRRGTGALFAATLIVVAVVLIDMFSGGVVRSAARLALAPFANFGRASVAAVSGGNLWSTRGGLLKENAELRIERDKLAAEGLGYRALQAQNESLSEMARLAETESSGGNQSGVTAAVISSFRASPYGTFIIGAGVQHGVREGSIVLAEGGFVIGVVSDVSNSSAVVRMVFAPGEKTDVVVGATGFSISGRGGGNASAEVPREAPVQEQSPVFAPGFENRPVGIIGKIESSTSSAYADVYVVFPQNLNTIRYVHVVPGVEI